ncbi:MAG TPA: porphobilinogen synthase [Methanomassiliicoccales archaeon]|nr:porphobilinogen synthase [Methanomassiliicoccales archaeon]
MVSETVLTQNDLIYPFFVNEGIRKRKPIPSMPGVEALPLSEVAKEAKRAEALGIPAVLLFGIPAMKDEEGGSAWDENGIVQKAVMEIKRVSDVAVVTDLCLCEYTSHGHCGALRKGKIENDETLRLYAKVAQSQAGAGADIIAPSGMMDGQVAAIRAALDEKGFEDVAIMAYSAKFASAFYGPFRDAAESAPKFGDRKSHQMDPANVREALREMELDLNEGADIIMVKPALAYLDVISAARREFRVPIAAYNVSGEYSMLKAAAQRGWIDGERMIMETLLSIKRAGADMIITYHALEAAEMLRGGSK